MRMGVDCGGERRLRLGDGDGRESVWTSVVWDERVEVGEEVAEAVEKAVVKRSLARGVFFLERR